MTWIQELITFASGKVTEREREELWGRGVTDAQIEQFQLGHLNEALPEGLPEHFLKWAKGKLDDVFVLPLTTVTGEIRGLQVRHVDRNVPGYSDYFLEQQEPCLFGLGQAAPVMWQHKYVLLVEGAFDLFPLQRVVPGVVATLTAYANPSFVRVLRRLVGKVWMGYDADEPGARGVKLFQEQHGNSFQVYVLDYPRMRMPNGKMLKDSNDLWEIWGDDRVRSYVRNEFTKKDLFGVY